MPNTKKKEDLTKNSVDEMIGNNSTDINEKRKPGAGGRIAKLVIIFFALGLVFALIFFNVGGVRDKFIRPVLEKIPVVKNVLPKKEEDSPETMTPDELLSEYAKMESENLKLKNLTEEMNNKMNDQNKELLRLQELEAQYDEFKKEKADFDSMIASEKPTEFIRFYEQMFPENAEIAYTKEKSNIADEKLVKKYIATFSAMEPDEIAPILEELMTTDMNLVVNILKNIDSQKAGGALAAMDPVKAASVSKQFAPEKFLKRNQN